MPSQDEVEDIAEAELRVLNLMTFLGRLQPIWPLAAIAHELALPIDITSEAVDGLLEAALIHRSRNSGVFASHAAILMADVPE